MLTALMKNRIVIASVALCAGFLLAYLVLPQPVPTSAEATETPQDQVFMVVEHMPELIGGMASIHSKMTYPESAHEAGVEGRVVVQFVVNEQGDVQDVMVARGIGSGCDEEAVRVVSEAKFTPGMQGGKPVKVRMAIPVTFKIA